MTEPVIQVPPSGTPPVTPRPAADPNPPAQLTEQQRQQAALAVLAANRAKTEAGANGDQPAPQEKPKHTKPDGVPDKFWNAETGEVNYKAWGESHASLETQFHQNKKPDDNKPATNADPNAQPKSARDEAAAEYARDGKLSDATYEKLKAEGFDREVVDTYIAGQQARVAPMRQAVFDGAEGQANYTAMIAWAAENLSPVEIEAYNAQLTSKNPEVLKAASKGLYAKYRAVVPVEGQRTGGGAPAGTGGRFNSKAEMTAAMNDPRYKTDGNFRSEVAQKMAASRAAGINLFI